MEKSFIAKVINTIFIILIIVGVVCLIPLPYLYNLVVGEFLPKFSEHTLYYRIAFYLCYIISVGILYMLFNTFHYLYKVSPFTKKIEKNLKVIAILFMLLFVIIFTKGLFLPTILTYAIEVICFVVSLCFYVLAEIIKKGIIYKDEVDNTI